MDFGYHCGVSNHVHHPCLLWSSYIEEQKVYFYFFKRPERYNQEVLSHSFICLPLPYVEEIILICNIDIYCVIAIFNVTGDMFKRWHFYTLNTNWSNKNSPRSLTHWCSHLTFRPHFSHSTMKTQNCKQRAMSKGGCGGPERPQMLTVINGYYG